jgi:predicted Zn-dependent peptidase
MFRVWLMAASLAATADIESYTLANGLRVALERQATFPTVAVHVTYGAARLQPMRQRARILE